MEVFKLNLLNSCIQYSVFHEAKEQVTVDIGPL